MSPLYDEEQTTQQPSASLQTQSNKFPIEREFVLSLGEKNSKISILHECKQKSAGRVAIAPDAPIKQQAWIQEVSPMEESKSVTRSKPYKTCENNSNTRTKSMKLDEEKTKSLSKTYHTIRDMISNRFTPNQKDVDLESESSLNNIAEELKKSNKSINEGEYKLQKYAYAISRNEEFSLRTQQYPKNNYGQYGHLYSYESNQTNVPLPGQLQSSNQFQPALLSGQGAQLYVTHHKPPGGIQTVHQTQISTFAPSMSVIQNSNRDYSIKHPEVLATPVMHQILHQTSGHNHNQVSMQIKHSMQQSQTSAIMQSNGPNSQKSQMIQQNFHHQNPRLQQQLVQNIHQRQIIHQLQKQKNYIDLPNSQNTLRNQHPHFSQTNSSIFNYQQYEQNKQTISRSHFDLPSTSKQLIHNLSIPRQEVYYHYNQNKEDRINTVKIYNSKDNNYEENKFQAKDSGKAIEKALSYPHLSFDERRNDNNITDESISIINNLPSESVHSKEKYEISVKESQTAYFLRNGSKKKIAIKDNRPEINCEIRSEQIKSSRKDSQRNKTLDDQESTATSIQKHIEVLHKNSEIEISQNLKIANNGITKIDGQKSENFQTSKNSKKSSIGMEEANSKRDSILPYNAINKETEIVYLSQRKDDLEHGVERLKIQHPGSGSDYDKAGQCSSNVDSGRGSAVYPSDRRLLVKDSNHIQSKNAEWVDIVESELRNILEPKDIPIVMHSNLSDSASSVTPPLPPVTPQESPTISRNQFSASLSYGIQPNYKEYLKGSEEKNYSSNTKHRSAFFSKKDSLKNFNHHAEELTCTTTGLDLDLMLDRSNSDLSTNDAQTIRKQLEGLENMYSEVLKLLSSNTKKKKKSKGLASYGSISSLPTSSVSSRPITKHHDKRRSYNADDRIKKVKDIKNINKRFQRLESHVVTLARSVAHLSSEMRTQHLMIQEMENIRSEITALRTQTNMAMVRSQSQPIIKDSELPALSNPYRVKKLTKFFGMEPPLIRLFLRELDYEKYAGAFEKEKVGMVELPYLSEERLQKMGVPLGPRLRILQEARISVCKDPVYVV